MARRPGEPGNGAAPGPQSGDPSASRDKPTRIDTLRTLLDRLTAAQATADALEERFLSYLLRMSVEETRAAMTRAGKPAV